MIKKCRLALKVSLAMLMTVFLVIPSSESRSEELVEKVEYWSSRVIAESLYIKSNTYRESIKASS